MDRSGLQHSVGLVGPVARCSISWVALWHLSGCPCGCTQLEPLVCMGLVTSRHYMQSQLHTSVPSAPTQSSLCATYVCVTAQGRRARLLLQAHCLHAHAFCAASSASSAVHVYVHVLVPSCKKEFGKGSCLVCASGPCHDRAATACTFLCSRSALLHAGRCLLTATCRKACLPQSASLGRVLESGV